jgi:hypothetical protein
MSLPRRRRLSSSGRRPSIAKQGRAETCHIKSAHALLGSHIGPPRFAAAAVKAIQKVEKVRTARQDRFYETRMATAKAKQAGAERKQLEQQIHLVKAPGALTREREAKLKGEGLVGGLAVVEAVEAAEHGQLVGWLGGCKLWLEGGACSGVSDTCSNKGLDRGVERLAGVAWLACYCLARAWQGSAERMRCYQHSASPDLARTTCHLLLLCSRCGGGSRGDAGMMRMWRQPRAAALCRAPAFPNSFVFPLPLIPCCPSPCCNMCLLLSFPSLPRLTTHQTRRPHCLCVSLKELLSCCSGRWRHHHGGSIVHRQPPSRGPGPVPCCRVSSLLLSEPAAALQ